MPEPIPLRYDDSLDDIVDAIERLNVGSHCQDILERRDRYQCTPLIRAVREERLDLVERLVQAGADVNATCCGLFEKNCVVPDHLMNTVLGAALDKCTGLNQLSRNTYDIIKCLIISGADLEAPVRGQTPIYIGCYNQIWPVVMELLRAGCKVDISQGVRPGSGNTLLHALSNTEQRDPARCQHRLKWDLPNVSCIDVLKSLIHNNPTLRLHMYHHDHHGYMTVLMYTVMTLSPDIFRLLLQSGKPIHGLEEQVDDLRLKIGLDGLRVAKVMSTQYGRRASPIQHVLIRLMYHMDHRCSVYGPQFGASFSWYPIWQLFSILSMLLDAGVTVHTLDFNSRQFVACARDWLEKHQCSLTNFDEKGLSKCYQILDQLEGFLCNPRRLDQLCRTQIRHILNIKGLSVQDFVDQHAISHILLSYLLYKEIDEMKEYQVSN